MPQNGDHKRPEPPSPDEYKRLQRDADLLRESPQSGRSARDEHRQRVQGGMHAYMRYTGIGIQFVVLLLLPLAGGYWLDKWLKTSPWLVSVGALLGGLGAVVWVVYTVLRMERRASQREGNKP